MFHLCDAADVLCAVHQNVLTAQCRSSKHENTLHADVDFVVVTSLSNVHTYKGYKKKLKKKNAGLDRK